jgi:hypothetical protein
LVWGIRSCNKQLYYTTTTPEKNNLWCLVEFATCRIFKPPLHMTFSRTRLLDGLGPRGVSCFGGAWRFRKDAITRENKQEDFGG